MGGAVGGGEEAGLFHAAGHHDHPVLVGVEAGHVGMVRLPVGDAEHPHDVSGGPRVRGDDPVDVGDDKLALDGWGIAADRRRGPRRPSRERSNRTAGGRATASVE